MGSADLADGVTGRAFLYSNGSMTELGTLGGAESGATGINDRSQVIGSANVRDMWWPNGSPISHIHPAYLKTVFDPANLYSVPYAYTLTLLGFNTNKIRELGLPADTWAIILEPEYLQKIKGRVTVLDSPRELMAAALLYLGYAANDQDEVHWNQAKELIIRAKPYWAAFSNTSYIREIAIGDLWVVHGYSNDLFQAALDAQKTGRHFVIDYAIPKQGAVMSSDSMVLHKSGKHPDLALTLLHFYLGCSFS